MRSSVPQVVLICLGLAVTALLGVFFYREVFPEYRIYQKDYVALEEFRSTYTGQPPPAFKQEIKQIVIERDDAGPVTVDRCTSCHVALKLPDFSPTKVAYDLNGNLRLDEKGWPLQVPNENYVFTKLDEKIAELRDEKVNEHLIANGEKSKVFRRLSEAKELENLKTAKVGEHSYDVTKVLKMHPLIGRETRPFEYHPEGEYGCTSCHGGNGRGLTTDKAHGPVFDGQYEIEFMGGKPQFLEVDEKHDPKFARVFNDKPGHGLLFQTTPILVGSLMQAKCVQCHQSTESAILGTVSNVETLARRKSAKSQAIVKGLAQEKEQLLALLLLRRQVKEEGIQESLDALKKRSKMYTLPPQELDQVDSQIRFLEHLEKKYKEKGKVVKQLNRQIVDILGSPGLAKTLEDQLAAANKEPEEILDTFLDKRLDDDEATGSIFVKLSQVNLEKALNMHLKDTESTFQNTLKDQRAISAMKADIDYLTQGYHHGKSLYLSQACYTCHRIAGFSRGGIGPELTRAGEGYPWYLKESIVWPQADLKTSTMPNYHLDHEEVEALMTYLLAQRGDSKVKSSNEKKIAIQEWEAGKKLPWEKAVTPTQIKDVRYGMTIFATEGCAACHRLKGFESNVGFAIEKGKPTFDQLYKEREWFSQLIPEDAKGSEIVKAISENAKEIDQRIADDVRTGALLEELEKNNPGLIESYNSNFKFALRSKDSKSLAEREAWQKRVRRVLMMYVQEYGLGRLVGPKPNWSGIYHSDEWLMEHFRNPSALVARSIMPVFPFDDSKFYALTYMLDVLAKKNRDEVREIWEKRGFDPMLAVKIHCAQCHGEFLQGHGPVAEWIYPIPKNLRNAQFLRNLTKERAIQSIVHGVKGTPMPPWGEVATDKPMADGIPVLTQEEATQIVEWLFSSLPGARVIRGEEDIPKWQYTPEDALQELEEEGNLDQFVQPKKLASLKPMVASTQVSDVFDVVPHPVPGTEENGYYIKKQYYTPENLWQGQQFFEVNCAVCHGKEGDGAGMRAEFLQEAKPRMLTNLNWIETRDDLRLIRSIKYGVAGTSMTPWGDLTNSLQRMQLVMYIRTLSMEPELRNQLFNALYTAFNRADRLIEEARVQQYQELEEVQKNLQMTKEKRLQATPEEAGRLYTQERNIQQEIKRYQERDQLLQDLKAEVKQERELYQGIGTSLISKMANGGSLNTVIQLIALNNDRYTFEEGKLQFNFDPKIKAQMDAQSEKILSEIETIISSLEEEKKRVEGKIASASRDLELNNLMAEIGSYQTLKNRTAQGVQQAKRSVLKQQTIYQKYQAESS